MSIFLNTHKYICIKMREYIFDITPFNYFTVLLMHENKYFNKWKNNSYPTPFTL